MYELPQIYGKKLKSAVFIYGGATVFHCYLSLKNKRNEKKKKKTQDDRCTPVIPVSRRQRGRKKALNWRSAWVTVLILVLKTNPKNHLLQSPLAGINAEIEWLHANLGLVAHACHPST